jgi:hypothetical protein
MKIHRLFPLLIPLLALSCDQVPPTDPMQPQVSAQTPEPVVFSMEVEANCTCKCTKCLPPNADACEFRCVYIGQCRDTPLAVDRNENGLVCGATEEGPYIDDVSPRRPFVPIGREPGLPCPSPAYPTLVEIEVAGS